MFQTLLPVGVCEASTGAEWVRTVTAGCEMTRWKKLPSPPARRRISDLSAQWSSPLSSNFASRDVIPMRPYGASQKPQIHFLVKG